MERNPGGWGQLAGNWEETVLNGIDLWKGSRKEPTPRDPRVLELVRGWREAGSMRVAAAVGSERGGAALTHAGLDQADVEPAVQVD